MGKLIVLVIALFFLSTCPLLADAKVKRGGKRGGGRGGGGGIGGSKGGRGGCETAKAKTYAGYVDAGNHLFQSGDMVKAGECYEQAALASPNDGLGWSNLGLTQMYRGDFDAAIVNMQKSIRLEPKNGRFHFVLGEAFSRSGNTQRAISSLETSIALDKNNPDAYLSLGNARMTEKRYSEALGAYEQALRLRETMEARVNLAKLRLQHGQIEAGMEDFKKAQRHAPNSPFVFAEMGEGLRSVGHIQQAVPYLQKAIESPVQTELDMRGKAKAHYGLAELAAREEKHSLALQHCAEAKKIDPKLAEVRMTEGVVLWHAGRLVEAERALREGTMLAPNMAEMHANHGLVLSELSQTKEAMDALNKAIKAKPTLAEAYKAKADILKGAMKYPEAIRQYQAALKIRPTYNEALNDLVHAQQHVCDWDVYEANFKAVHEGLKREKEGGNYPLWVKPFHALVYPLSLPDTLFVSESYARRAMGRVRYQVQTPFSLSWGLTPTSTGSIRIGYVSSNMGDHSLSHLMQNVFNMHRRVESDVDVWRGPAIEVYCYALNPSDGSNYRKTVEAGCDRFFDGSTVNALTIAKQANEDNVRILIDMVGYTGGGEKANEIFALKPTPHQTSYMGYCASTGAFDYMHSIIVDRIVAPPDFARFYSEKLIYLPRSYYVTDHRQSMMAPAEALKELETAHASGAGLDGVLSPLREEFGVKGGDEDEFLFACFNQLYKIDPVTFDNWTSIIGPREHSRLWLLSFPASAEKNLRAFAKSRKRDHLLRDDRLIFSPTLPKEKYIRRAAIASLFLDSPLVNAHTTATDALWAGLPVLTYPGERMVTRVAASLVHAAGLDDLIALDRLDYVQKAKALAGKSGWRGSEQLRMSRQKLASTRMSSPVFDTERWVRGEERAFAMVVDAAAAEKGSFHIIVKEPRSLQDE